MTKIAQKKPKTAAKRLTGRQVLHWLQKNPSFFEKNKDALGSMVVPRKGGNIVSLHAAKAEKVAAENQRLRVRQKQLVAMASANVSTAEDLFAAMAAMMRVDTLPALRSFVQGPLREILDVPLARLYRLGDADTATTLTEQTLLDWCPEPVTLKALETPAEREVYGTKGKMLRSDCRLQLRDGDALVGLMLLASGDAARFHAGQGTDMVRHFGRAVGACMARLDAGRQVAPAAIKPSKSHGQQRTRA